ncbi:hypothetical protein AMATHDRAFT_81612 [Amanita thiersii Skay4041]|uniref:Xylanolytic transcriptional activator regulatory domain-containing protein n=1 Tax=Amanita thiersii Skay4041 TaxID=703135 RepID=A0A2A9NFG7_9AGAR|nr:hypothetical protein AMATHDRAFT_81612 [Amanita thiersii Skay4041]
MRVASLPGFEVLTMRPGCLTVFVCCFSWLVGWRGGGLLFRRRRIKCDEGHPCQACLTANSACTFEEPGKRTHPHKSKRTATLEDRMQHLETLIQAIPPAVFAAGGTLPPSSLGHLPADSAPLPNPIAAFGYPPSTAFPSGVPPPSLHVFPLMNPSTHFKRDSKYDERQKSPVGPFSSFLGGPFSASQSTTAPDQLAEETSKLSLTASYLYFDDEGCTRWQGETSGLPVLDLLVELHATSNENDVSPNGTTSKASQIANTNIDWFPNRTPRRTDMNPQVLWKLITSSIIPELMDSLVQCYLSTSYYILPFLHVPSFLADYGNPQKWAEPGFAAFIVAICCLASRHMDDPRVRSDPNDGISAGTQWFELFGRLRTLPIADRPSLYNIQSNLIAAVYAVGLGRLSKAAALLGECVTMCIDAGLHRSADTWDLFDPIENEVRKRTFWCVYIWDKQLGAHFGRPPLIRLRDCDVPEPAPVDDEYISKEAVGVPPPGIECRLSAFIITIRIMTVLESVLDVPPARHSSDSSSSFLLRASFLSGSRRGFRQMREEEALLDEIHMSIPHFWSHTAETLSNDDTIRVTQAERLHCAEHFVRMLIYRHRFSELVAERTNGVGGVGNGMNGMGLLLEDEQCEAEKEAMIAAHNSALQIVATHVHIAKKGLMTYYGVHVIHQLTQAGRTLVAVLLCCKSEPLQHLIPPGLDALRSCIGLLRRFSGRYVCGLRSGDLMEEFCRVTRIPLDIPRPDGGVNGNGTSHMNGGSGVGTQSSRPPWIRPVRKKMRSGSMSGGGPRSTHSGDSPSHHSSPESFSPPDFFVAGGDGSNTGPSPPFHSPQMGGNPSSGVSGGTQGSNQPPSLFGIDGGMDIDILRSTGGPGPGVSNGSAPGGGNGDAQMYMSPADIMANFFGDGSGGGMGGVGVGTVGVGVGVDAGQLFGTELAMGPHPQQQQQQQQGRDEAQGFGPGASASAF